MALDHLTLETDADGIALLTFNRPAKLNALNRTVLLELRSALEQIREDVAIRAVILTGAGEKAFVAGADISELAAADPLQAVQSAGFGQNIFRQLEISAKPSVAAINGFALGGGLELAMACTIRVAAATAKVGQAEVKLGIIAGYGGTQRLPRLVGRGRALELLLTGEMIDAGEAHRIGLVNHVVPPAELLTFSRELLRKILQNAPVAVGLTMQSVDVGLSCGLEEGLRFEATAFGLAAGTDDRMEGTRAFLEKRAANFRGK